MDGKLIQNNWQEINSIIAKAAQFAGRPVGDIRIVGVAKKQPEERVKAAVEAGLGIIGENYAQEFLTRRTQFQDPKLKWHFVGHLQSNKAKLIVGEVELIHSVDRLSLAEKIGQVAQTKSMVQ